MVVNPGICYYMTLYIYIYIYIKVNITPNIS